MDINQAIFDCWNAQSEFGKWKTHRKVRPDIIKAIKENIDDGWEVDDIVSSICNFAKIVQGSEYKWTYDQWTLAHFLTRGKREEDRRWIWFTDNNFVEDEWLTEQAKQQAIRKTRPKPENPTSPPRKRYSELTDDELLTTYNEATQFVQQVIRRREPRIAGLVKNDDKLCRKETFGD